MSERGLQPSSDDAASRRRFETEGVYSSRTICRKLQNESRDYIDELLADKLDTIRAHVRPGMLVDLCCATGGHLLDLSGLAKQALGIDFSQPYVAKAQQDAIERGIPNVRFVVGNAKALPLRDGAVATLYSLSALYVIPKVEDVLAELDRVLAPGGRAILDLQNSWSLNAFCLRYYTDIAPTFPISVSQMRSLVASSNLRIVEHRAFQILPLWAGKPDWLWPLLHPRWKRVMKHRLKGRMIDEWISNFWLFKRFAARHLVVVEKVA